MQGAKKRGGGRRRKENKNKGQGMDTNPFHASRTGVTVAKTEGRPDMLIYLRFFIRHVAGEMRSSRLARR